MIIFLLNNFLVYLEIECREIREREEGKRRHMEVAGGGKSRRKKKKILDFQFDSSCINFFFFFLLVSCFYLYPILNYF